MSRNENLTISVEKSIKILHFSDGVMEVFEDDHNVNESHKEESVDEVFN